MEMYIGIGFIFLCFAVLASIIGYFGYQLYLAKEKIEITPADNSNQSNKQRDE